MTSAAGDAPLGPLFEISLFVVLVGGFVWFIVWQYKLDQARKTAMMGFVASQGYEYRGHANDRTSYFASPPFGIGVERTAKHIVSGNVAGVAFETFAYQYKTREADSKGHTRTQKHPYQVTWIPLPTSLPTMRFTPDNAFLRLGKALGARDLDTESDDFNNAWKVWCDDERLGHAVLTPRMIALFLRPEVQGRAYVLEPRGVMTYQAGHSDLTDTPFLVHLLADIADRIPKFLSEDERQSSPPPLP